MKIRRLLFVIMIAAVVLNACAPGASRSNTGAPEPGAAPYYAPAEVGAVSSDGVAAPGYTGAEAGKGGSAQAATVDRLVIKNASLTMVVANPAEASDHIAGVANSLGGFVVSSYVYQASVDAAGNNIMRANITVRVPSAQLDAALAQVRGLAVEVRTENISGQDVTAEYTDLESRVRNLEVAEAQLTRIMDGANKTEDVLAVFNQLTYIRQEIEQVKGQMKYYRESAAMSAVTVELLPDALSQPIQVGGWRPQGVVRDAVEALVGALQGLATAIIWIGILILPLALVLGVPVILALRFLVRRIRRPRPSAA
jgi:hypothetical protein